jgi:hypothetical protein
LLKGKNTMNTQNATSEIASNALATLAAALEAGNSAALTAYPKVNTWPLQAIYPHWA